MSAETDRAEAIAEDAWLAGFRAGLKANSAMPYETLNAYIARQALAAQPVEVSDA